jgi:hypothetical protein
MLCIVGLGHKSPSLTAHFNSIACPNESNRSAAANWAICGQIRANLCKSDCPLISDVASNPRNSQTPNHQPINPSTLAAQLAAVGPNPNPSLQNTARDLWEVPVETFREVLRQPQPGHGWGKEMIDKNMSIPGPYPQRSIRKLKNEIQSMMLTVQNSSQYSTVMYSVSRENPQKWHSELLGDSFVPQNPEISTQRPCQATPVKLKCPPARAMRSGQATRLGNHQYIL